MKPDTTPFAHMTNEEFLLLVQQTNAPIQEALILRLENLMEAVKELQKDYADLLLKYDVLGF